MKNFEVELAMPAEEAWVAVGKKFGNTGQWASSLDSSYLVGELAAGGHRVCKQGEKTLTEHLTQYDPESMTLAYEMIEGRPQIVKSAGNRWSIESLGKGRCRVIMSPVVKLKWWALWLLPLMSLGLNATLSGVMEEFKYWAETGDVHPRKKVHDAKRALK